MPDFTIEVMGICPQYSATFEVPGSSGTYRVSLGPDGATARAGHTSTARTSTTGPASTSSWCVHTGACMTRRGANQDRMTSRPRGSRSCPRGPGTASPAPAVGKRCSRYG